MSASEGKPIAAVVLAVLALAVCCALHLLIGGG
jgi:hypothetical protein